MKKNRFKRKKIEEEEAEQFPKLAPIPGYKAG